MRLGFPVKILARPGLRSHDSRRWQSKPHLSVSLAYLRDLFLHLGSQDIHMYRLSDRLAPYLTHPGLPHFHRQIEECAAELAALGQLAQALDLRLSLHAPASVLLNALDPARQTRSQIELEAFTHLFEAMGLGPDAAIIIHVGGHYQRQPEQALAQFIAGCDRLPPAVRDRIALEHDDHRFSVADCLWLHERTGLRLIFDLLHHQLYNPSRLPPAQALAACLATWPPEQTPKIHLSTPATELVRDGRGGPHPPRLNRHSHFLNPFPLIDFLRSLPRLRPFDAMIEAKACDLALLQFRRHLAAFAPDLAQRFQVR